LVLRSRTGIELFKDGKAISGDITGQMMLWDAGTEVDQEPGIGSDQGPAKRAEHRQSRKRCSEQGCRRQSLRRCSLCHARDDYAGDVAIVSAYFHREGYEEHEVRSLKLGEAFVSFVLFVVQKLHPHVGHFHT
jgi:hypothetical protein